MPILLDLPPEVLAVVASHVLGPIATKPEPFSPPSELPPRSIPAHLLTCERWFEAALPVWRDTLDLQQLYFSVNDLSRLPAEGRQIYKYACTKIEKVSIRLIGQPSTDTALGPFFEDSEEHFAKETNGSSEPEEFSGAERSSNDNDHTAKYPEIDINIDDNDWEEQDYNPNEFKKQVARSLPPVSRMLARCTNLSEYRSKHFRFTGMEKSGTHGII